MAEISFGVQYNGIALGSLIGPLDFAEKAEAWGYQSLIVPDLEVSPAHDPLMLLAAAAQRTTHLRLGTGVLVLPFRHPYQLAKTSLSLSELSGGRFFLGLGSGLFQKDFDAEEVDIHRRGKIFDERLDLLTRLLDGESVTHEGKFHQLKNVRVVPPAGQPTKPPIWIGASWHDGFAAVPLQRTARWADAFYPHEAPVHGYAAGKRTIEEKASAFNRDPATIEWACMLWLGMGESKDLAHKEAQAGLIRRFGNGAWEVLPDNGYALGSAADCVETVQAYAELGVTHFVLNALGEPEQALMDYERFASEVIPAIST